MYFNPVMQKKCGKHDNEVNNPTIKPKQTNTYQKVQSGRGGKKKNFNLSHRKEISRSTFSQNKAYPTNYTAKGREGISIM